MKGTTAFFDYDTYDANQNQELLTETGFDDGKSLLKANPLKIEQEINQKKSEAIYKKAIWGRRIFRLVCLVILFLLCIILFGIGASILEIRGNFTFDSTNPIKIKL